MKFGGNAKQIENNMEDNIYDKWNKAGIKNLIL